MPVDSANLYLPELVTVHRSDVLDMKFEFASKVCTCSEAARPLTQISNVTRVHLSQFNVVKYRSLQ